MMNNHDNSNSDHKQEVVDSPDHQILNNYVEILNLPSKNTIKFYHLKTFFFCEHQNLKNQVSITVHDKDILKISGLFITRAVRAPSENIIFH